MSLTTISLIMNKFGYLFLPLKLVLYLGSISLSITAFAIDPHSNLPINIESDTALLDDSKGISLYEGNVIISQGETKLSAEKITVMSKERRITKIEANGDPALFEQRSADNTLTQGSAKIITYIAKDNTLRFKEKAELSQSNNSFSGEVIEYDLARKAIKATGNEAHGERVKIQYHPEQPHNDNPTPNQ